MEAKHWMSWEGGVDIAAVTEPTLTMPNVIVHVARMVHTPVGSTPAGLVLIQPDANGAPLLFGYVCEDRKVGRYFGPRIFVGTPFEKAPIHQAKIDIVTDNGHHGARVRVGHFEIVTRLSNLGVPDLIHRAPGAMPFAQQGIEQPAGQAEVTLNGKPIAISLPKIGLGGGASAVYTPCGIYAR